MKKTIILLLMLAFTALGKAQSNEVLFETTEGNIRVMLYDDTPIHRDNFLKLVNEQFYDSLLFHRVIKSFMIQGGDPTSKTAEPGTTLGTGELDYTLEPEFRTPKHYHRRGALAMAREGDRVNPERRSIHVPYPRHDSCSFGSAPRD